MLSNVFPLSVTCYRPGTIAVTRTAEKRESDAITGDLSRSQPDKVPLTILSHHYQTRTHN